MEPLYKSGDKIKVRTDIEQMKILDGLKIDSAKLMRRYYGMTMTVKDVRCVGKGMYRYTLENCRRPNANIDWLWAEPWLDPAEPLHNVSEEEMLCLFQ